MISELDRSQTPYSVIVNQRTEQKIILVSTKIKAISSDVLIHQLDTESKSSNKSRKLRSALITAAGIGAGALVYWGCSKLGSSTTRRFRLDNQDEQIDFPVRPAPSRSFAYSYHLVNNLDGTYTETIQNGLPVVPRTILCGTVTFAAFVLPFKLAQMADQRSASGPILRSD